MSCDSSFSEKGSIVAPGDLRTSLESLSGESMKKTGGCILTPSKEEKKQL